MPPSPNKKQRTSPCPFYERVGDGALYLHFRECMDDQEAEKRLWNDDEKDQDIMHLKRSAARTRDMTTPWLVTKSTILSPEWALGIDLQVYFQMAEKQLGPNFPQVVQWLILEYYAPLNAFARHRLENESGELSYWTSPKTKANV